MGKRIVAVIMSIVLTVPMVSIYKETDSRAATMGKVNQTGITSIEASTLPIQTKFKKTISKKFKSIQNKNRLNGSKNISKDTLRDGEHSYGEMDVAYNSVHGSFYNVQ